MRWMALLKENVPDLDLQKYSGFRFLFSKRSAVNPFRHDVFFVIYQIFRKVNPTNYIQISPRTSPIPLQNQNQGNGYLKASLLKARHWDNWTVNT